MEIASMQVLAKPLHDWAVLGHGEEGQSLATEGHTAAQPKARQLPNTRRSS